MDAYLSDQDLINSLYQNMQGEKHARERGDAKALRNFKAVIASVLNALAERGYCKLECVEACE